jgi:predicted MPP superfamily phosphohydrolase
MALPFVAKVVAAAFMLAASQFHFWSKLSSGSVFAPEFPRSIVILFNWANGSILFLALMQLLLDVGLLVIWAASGDAPVAPDALRFVMAGAASLLGAIGVVNAVRVPPLKDVDLLIRDLPPQYEGYTILQLTDLHISRLFPATWTRKVVERSNALDVDLIAVTGDVIDGSLAMRRADVAPFAELKAKDGVFMSPGNHEYFLGFREWIQHFADLGMHVLANAHAILERGGARLMLAGVSDRSAPATRQPRPDLAAALAGGPGGVPIILLDHQPAGARRAAARGVNVQLSGHTHGGMMPGLDRLVARGNAGFVSGSYDVDGMTLYVNNGTGIWPGFALRLRRPSELTRLTLRCAP